MFNDTKFEFTKLQYILLCITGIAFIALIWDMFPLDNILKVAICCFIGTFILLIVISFAECVSYFKKITSAKIATTITILVFLTFPLAISIMHGIHEQEYLESYPANNQISVRITYDIDRVGGSGSIGSEWTYEHFLNKKKFQNGDILSISAKVPFTITSRCIERDSIDDIGESTSKQYKYSQNNNYKKTLTISQKVHVTEQGGRRYAGSTADFKVIYTLERVIPTSMGYWDVLLYTSNDTEYALCLSLIAGQILCAICVIFVLINGTRKQAYANEQERIKKAQELEKERQKKEEEFLAGRTQLIERLQGRSVRQAAGVPIHVSFENDLPKDNNDALYGTFTVYCSNSGSCYHDKRGCCSARHPMHYFKAQKKLRPCSKCCTERRSIPQWYTDYTTLKNQVQYYQLDIPE